MKRKHKRPIPMFNDYSIEACKKKARKMGELIPFVRKRERWQKAPCPYTMDWATQKAGICIAKIPSACLCNNGGMPLPPLLALGRDAGSIADSPPIFETGYRKVYTVDLNEEAAVLQLAHELTGIARKGVPPASEEPESA
jgi:hypothetical protein